MTQRDKTIKINELAVFVDTWETYAEINGSKKAMAQPEISMSNA